MKGFIETPGLPKADCRRGLARLYLLSVLCLSYSCLLVGGLQENRTTHAVTTFKFCLAKAFPLEA